MAREDEPVRITTAARNPEEDIASRQKRYVISMSIRLVCFLAAAAFAPHWPMWLLLAGAVFLPYVAVVGANAKDMRRDDFELEPASPQWALPSGHGAAIAGEATAVDDEPHHEANR